MNKLTIIGNLTRDAELRTTQSGKNVCSFTVAVNRKYRRDNDPEADFFDVSIWEDQARNLYKYLCKGKKVCVIGAVSVRTYTGNDGTTRAKMEITFPEIELLSKNENPAPAPAQHEERIDQETGYSIADPDELPF